MAEPFDGDDAEVSRLELLSAVCGYFCRDGLTPAQIQQRVDRDHGVTISREEPYRMLAECARRGWFHFVPPLDLVLRHRLKERYPWLQEVSVVSTLQYEDVAERGAKLLLELLQQHFRGREAHVGFSGGYALRALARRFAALLREPADHLPSSIAFHAMVAGFDVYDPTTDPNAFFTYFVRDAAMQVETSFVGLHAPAIVAVEVLERLRSLKGIAEAFEEARKLDVIATSASCWRDEHCTFRQYMELAGESVEEFARASCVGDMLWQPLGPRRPIELETATRAMTVVDLPELSSLVERGKQVLLVAGPCGRCHRPKTDVVRAILEQERQLITHLVVDSRCARDLLQA